MQSLLKIIQVRLHAPLQGSIAHEPQFVAPYLYLAHGGLLAVQDAVGARAGHLQPHLLQVATHPREGEFSAVRSRE